MCVIDCMCACAWTIDGGGAGGGGGGGGGDGVTRSPTCVHWLTAKGPHKSPPPPPAPQDRTLRQTARFGKSDHRLLPLGVSGDQCSGGDLGCVCVCVLMGVCVHAYVCACVW